MFYFRPGQLPREFVIEHRKGELDGNRRVKATYREQGTLKAALAQATPQEIKQWHQRS